MKTQLHAEMHLITDESYVYKRVGKHFSAHSTVNHGKKEYARVNVTSNTVEASFTIFKRGLTALSTASLSAICSATIRSSISSETTTLPTTSMTLSVLMRH